MSLNFFPLNRSREVQLIGPHDHPIGPHGGSVVAIDRDNRHHAEAVLEPEGRLVLYTFREQLTDILSVPKRTVCSAVRGHDGANEYSVMLRPDSQATDLAGTASRFVGRVPPSILSRHSIRLVVWEFPIDSNRYLFEIEIAGLGPESEAASRAVESESVLYSTSGGVYSEADILVNGRMPPSEKFRSLRSAHDDRVATGDRVCPISGSKVNPSFPWLIGGKKYLFCCPPCIDDFVTTAKVRHLTIREPDFYRRR